MFSSWIRRVAFWTMDGVKGGNIRRQYCDIKKIMQMPICEQQQIQEKYLKNIIEHAIQTVPFYYECQASGISEMPVVNKTVIKENFKDFQSTTSLNKKKHSMSTSGSTGVPFTIYQDMRKRSRVLAELIYFNEVIDQRIGDRFCYFRVWTENDLSTKRNKKIAMFAKNEIPVDIAHLDDANMEKIRQLLKKDASIGEIIGYPSTFKRLVQYIEKCDDSPSEYHLKAVVSSSEMLDSTTKRKLQEKLGCTVVSRYSNQENGILAQQCKNSNKYHVNSASYYIEILKLDSDEPAELGESGRVVVTDLFNYAMPLIRYDTGDLAVQSNQCHCGWETMILGDLQGRRVDVCMSPDGNLLSPLLLDKFMEPFERLAQFQFIQEDKNYYVLKINDPKKMYSDTEFHDMLKKMLGENAIFEIIRVNDNIPCLDSGKFKQMVCNYKRQF